MGKCSGLTKNVMKSMNDVEISEWQCNTCKLYSQRQSATAEVSQSALELTPNEEKFERLLKQNESISAKLTSVLNRMYEELIVHLDNQDKTITELQRKIGELEGKISQRDEEVGELRKAIDNAELYSRSQNIEIHGMVQQPNEDIMSVINRVATKLDLAPVTPNDIEAAHRLKAKEGRITPILVRFTERRTRDLWVRKRTTLRN
ncbi:unnamed protein product [Ixodes pacificus]